MSSSPAGGLRVDPAELRRHLLRMRSTAVVFLLSVALLGPVAYRLPRETSPLVPPLLVTLGALAAALWLAFTADRDARERLRRIKDLFPAHRNEQRLLRDHLFVYLVVLIRLEAAAACGLITAVWGSGPTSALFFFAVVAVLMALAWPTRAKSELLLRRVRG